MPVVGPISGPWATMAHAAALRLHSGWIIDEPAQLAAIYGAKSRAGADSVRPAPCDGVGSGGACPPLRLDLRLWDLRTPFLMDQQAEREATRLETAAASDKKQAGPKRRHRRGKESSESAESREERLMVMEGLARLLEERRSSVDIGRSRMCKVEDLGFVGQSTNCVTGGYVRTLNVTKTDTYSLNAMSDYVGDQSDQKAVSHDSSDISETSNYGTDSSVTDGPSPTDFRLNNRPAREAARHVLEHCPPPLPPFSGSNDTDSVQLTNVQGRVVAIPPYCRFLCDDVTAAFDDVSVVERLVGGRGKFDCVVMDPPWNNKFVRRKRRHNQSEGYRWLDAASLHRLPIGSLTSPGALVAVWCTNKAAHVSTLRNVLFPAWGVTEVATWYWVKVTKHGVPVTPGGGHSKLPYERLVLGRAGPATSAATSIEPHRLLVSVPCALHSRKPLLNEVLVPYLPSQYQGLEVFARGLLPGWTSWGDQVLLLQQLGTLLLPQGAPQSHTATPLDTAPDDDMARER